MGGLACGDKKIKTGMIYRTPLLSGSTEEERTFLDSLGIDLVFDFRCWEEIAENPDYRIPGTEYRNIPVFDGRKYKYIVVSKRARRRAALLFGNRAEKIRENKTDSYAEMPFSDAYSEVFSAMDKGKKFAFHCTEGKDRTGVLAAIIEYCLGRTEEQIREEYLLSNELRPNKDRSSLRRIPFLVHLVEVAAYCETTHDDLFDIALSAIEERYGDVDTYLLKHFGISRERKEKWREIYLENA